jgi:protein-disulfide isomerase
MERIKSDMNSPEIARTIEQDLADAKTMNVTMTPEYFVNGRPLPSFGFEQLKALVDEALVNTNTK